MKLATALALVLLFSACARRPRSVPAPSPAVDSLTEALDEKRARRLEEAKRFIEGGSGGSLPLAQREALLRWYEQGYNHGLVDFAQAEGKMTPIAGKPDKTDLFVETDGERFLWPFCVMPWCSNRILLGVSMHYCFPHSAECLNIQPDFPVPDLEVALQVLRGLN